MATIRKLPSGKFQAVIRLSGSKPIYHTCRTKTQAKAWLRNHSDDEYISKHGKIITDLVTFSEIVDLYLKADEVEKQPDPTNPLKKPKTKYKSKDPSTGRPFKILVRLIWQ